MQNSFEPNLNEISRERFKSEEQKSTLENIKLLWKSQKAVIKLFHGYSSIVFEAKYKLIHGKRISKMSAPEARGRVAKICNHKVFDHSNRKIISPKQIIQRLSTILAQKKAGNLSENLLNEIR